MYGRRHRNLKVFVPLEKCLRIPDPVNAEHTMSKDVNSQLLINRLVCIVNNVNAVFTSFAHNSAFFVGDLVFAAVSERNLRT